MVERPEGGWNFEGVTAHPGEMLREEFLIPLDMDAEELASRLHISVDLVRMLTEERGPVTPDLALRLEIFFGMSAQFWLNLQLTHDLTKAKLDSEQQLRDEIQPYKQAA